MKRDLYKIIFYNKDGGSFQDTLMKVDKHNMTEFQSATSENTSCAKEETYVESFIEKVEDNLLKKYYVKKCTVGGNMGQFINPYGPMSNAADLTKVDTRSGRRYYEYAEVTLDVFNNYIQFLKTRNPAYLNQATRDSLSKTR